MKPHPWSELVERYSRFEERFEGGVPPPATDGAIQAMLQSAQNDDLVVPDDNVEYLKMRNGASFSGLMLYAADIAESDSYHRLDRASWDTIDEFRTCDELLVSIFAAQTEALERAG
jgi:hypothetical protein